MRRYVDVPCTIFAVWYGFEIDQNKKLGDITMKDIEVQFENKDQQIAKWDYTVKEMMEE